MTISKLASLIAKSEGKKHQASIGDIREILRIIAQTPGAAVSLFVYSLRKRKKARK